jgi:hypothetical protein
LTSRSVGGELVSFTPGERASGTHEIGGYVDPIAGLDDVEKRKFLTLHGLELRPVVVQPIPTKLPWPPFIKLYDVKLEPG